ncbi:MAG: ribulose-bisphosphate carboxylase large subunit [Candidatus Helarchaeota archaeon]
MNSFYLALGENIKADDGYIIVRMKVKTTLKITTCAKRLAAESSIGTWTDISTMTPEIKRLAGKIFEINDNEIKIAYPVEMFEASIPQILADIAGNIFGMKDVDELRLEEVEYPKKFIYLFKGPQFGIKGVRKFLKIEKRPLIGTIIKPKIGLPPKEHARVAYEAWVGGIDFVKDDENLTSQSFNPFKERVIETLQVLDKAETKTGDKKNYAPNISAPYNEMLERAEIVKDNGGKCVMLDVITCGYSAVQSFNTEPISNIFIKHGHRAMHAAMTRYPNQGIHMSILVMMARMCGLDQFHVGTVVGKMEGEEEEVKRNIQACTLDCGIKTTFPVNSGGLHPRHVASLMKLFGNDIIIQAGGGIHGHPKGTKAGAMAMKQAVDAIMADITLEEYAKKHAELEASLKKWN